MRGSPGDHEDDERGRGASLVAAVAHGVRKGLGRRGASGADEGGAETSPARKTAGEGRAGLRSLAGLVIDAAPRVPVRDLETLRRQFPGLGPEDIADRLVAGALKATMTVGASVGAAAMLPTPPAIPAELAAETLGVAALEYKLIAELHEVYGLRVPGGPRERTAAYLWSWTQRRGINLLKLSSVNAALSGPMKRQMRQRLLRRTARHLPVLTPFMVGAAVGALMNRRDTKKLAEQVRKDLRTGQVPWEQPWTDEAPTVGEPPPVLGEFPEGGQRPPVIGP